MLISFAKSLDPDLDPNHLTFWWGFWKNFLKKFILKALLKPIQSPCEIEFLTKEQFKNSSWNLARILEQFMTNCTWTVQEHKLRMAQELFKNLWRSWIFHNFNVFSWIICWLWCSWSVLKCVLDYFKDFSWTWYVLELFLNLFLTISKTVLELHILLNCA